MRARFLHRHLRHLKLYRRPLVARLVRAGIFGTGNAWQMQTSKPRLVVIDGGRR